MITETQYAEFCAICDKAQEYWKANATYSKSGWSSMSAELSAHPDYSACTNGMRGKVEQFEILRDLPDQLTAYVGSNSLSVTTWTGDKLGGLWQKSVWRNCYGTRMYSYRASIGGKEYTGRSQGAHCIINLRAVKCRK